MTDFIIKNIGECITFEPLVTENRFTNITDQDLGIKSNVYVHIQDGLIHKIDTMNSYDGAKHSLKEFDAKGNLLVPGLIDCHTHPVFSGDRSEEYWQKRSGATYQEIAKSGGGINASVKATRDASFEELSTNYKKVADRFLKNGVTTFEAKTGYGLSVDSELKLLDVINDTKVKQQVVKTVLALHAVPMDAKSKEAYIEEITGSLLPKVKGRCDYVDAFIEEGYFSPKDCEKYFRVAKELGIDARVHADEFCESGAASFAASIGAHSGDHLQMASDEGIREMASAGTVAVLLPGTSLYSGIAFADARRFKSCAVAIATDFNPGSCGIDDLLFLANVATVQSHLSPAAAIAAITWVAARSLRLEGKKGALAQGYDADMCLYPFKNHKQWLCDFAKHKPQAVWVKGLG